MYFTNKVESQGQEISNIVVWHHNPLLTFRTQQLSRTNKDRTNIQKEREQSIDYLLFLRDDWPLLQQLASVSYANGQSPILTTTRKPISSADTAKSGETVQPCYPIFGVLTEFIVKISRPSQPSHRHFNTQLRQQKLLVNTITKFIYIIIFIQYDHSKQVVLSILSSQGEFQVLNTWLAFFRALSIIENSFRGPDLLCSLLLSSTILNSPFQFLRSRVKSYTSFIIFSSQDTKKTMWFWKLWTK